MVLPSNQCEVGQLTGCGIGRALNSYQRERVWLQIHSYYRGESDTDLKLYHDIYDDMTQTVVRAKQTQSVININRVYYVG